MNQFRATVKKIENVNNLHLVSFDVGHQIVKMLSLELNELFKVDSDVLLSVKSTNIAIAKDFTGLLSYENQLDATILNVENGKLLSSVELEIEGFKMEAIIPLNASLKMNLQKANKVIALIRETEVSLLKTL